MEFQINTPVRVRDGVVPDSDDYVPGGIGVMVRDVSHHFGGRPRVQCLGTESLFTIDPDWLEATTLTAEQAIAIKAQVDQQANMHPVAVAKREVAEERDRLLRVAREYGAEHSKQQQVEEMIERMGYRPKVSRYLRVEVRRQFDVWAPHRDNSDPTLNFDASLSAPQVVGVAALIYTDDLPENRSLSECICDLITERKVREQVAATHPSIAAVESFTVSSVRDRTCPEEHWDALTVQTPATTAEQPF